MSEFTAHHGYASVYFDDDGTLSICEPGESISDELNPSEAVNLASALLQYATRNADWWKVNGEAE